MKGNGDGVMEILDGITEEIKHGEKNQEIHGMVPFGA